MPDSVPREAIEDQWRVKVQAAHQRYDEAVANCQRALEQWQELPRPDGAYGVLQARQRESAARREWMRLLKVFTDLTVYDKLPPPE